MERSSSSVGAFVMVVAALIVAVGLMAAGAIVARGDYGGPCAVVDSGPDRVMSENMEMDVMLQMGSDTAMQKMSYDHASNTVLVEAPANFNGSSGATIAIDYDRSLVIISIHGEQVCVGSVLKDNMADATVSFMQLSTEEAIDFAASRLDSSSYRSVGIIPASYVSSSNGLTVRGLCSGREFRWTEMTATQSKRRKRAIGPINIKFCVWRLCFDINVDFN